MDGFRVVKLSEVIRQMDVVITCTGMEPHAVTSIISALMGTALAVCKYVSHFKYHSLLIQGFSSQVISFRLFICREQERCFQRASWPNEKWLHCLQYGTFQYRDRCGNFIVFLLFMEKFPLKKKLACFKHNLTDIHTLSWGKKTFVFIILWALQICLHVLFLDGIYHNYKTSRYRN